MAMRTTEEALRALATRITAIELEISRLRRYAESTNSMHHEAIVALHTKMGGNLWPTRKAD